MKEVKTPETPGKEELLSSLIGIIAILGLFFISSFSVTNLKGRQMEEMRQVMLYAVLVNALTLFHIGFCV